MNKLFCLTSLFCLFAVSMIAQTKETNQFTYRTSGLSQPIFVYNNWSAYDELSDNIPLDEELAMKELDNIIRLKKEGVRIDYYLMDAFWFDSKGGYRTWRKDCWPEGPQRWLEACKKNGLKPGLWFSTNLLKIGNEKNTLEVIPEWKNSVSEDGSTLCLFQGGYLSHLMETLQIYVDWGVKLFKFDFAYFDAATSQAKRTMCSDEIKRRNKDAFFIALKEFRIKNPDVLLIGYNGFGGDMENTVTPFRKTIDLRWLEVFDTMYCGDPRLSDVPMMNFWRSQDLYSDHMVFQYLFNGVPIQRIDNCAFMIGTTGTCYNRALNAWHGMAVLAMARGGWLNVYHGNIDLLSKKDAQWLAKLQKLYLPAQQFGRTKAWGGIPGKSLPYGYETITENGILYTVVNASQSKRMLHLPKPLKVKGKGRILFHDDGFIPILQNDSIVLGPEQLAVVGFGKFNDVNLDLGVEKDVVIPIDIQKIETIIQVKDEHTLQAKYTPTKDKNIRIILQQLDSDSIPFRSWGGAPPLGKSMDNFFKIEVKQGNKILPQQESFNKIIWCGLSWAVIEISSKEISLNEDLYINCSIIDGKSKNCKLRIFETMY